MTAHPIHTDAQTAGEEAVRVIWQMPDVQAARQRIAGLWRLAYGIDRPEQQLATFDSAMDEFLTNYLFKAAASDAYNPGFLRDFMPAHLRAGQYVAGARMGGDNPDNCYRLVGIAHGERYLVRGWTCGVAPANVSFSLTGNYGTSVTIDLIEHHQLVVEPDGSFVITIDPDESNGRPNHLRTAPNVKFLFVRDSMADWIRECPFGLSIERVGGERRAPISHEEIAARAIFRAAEDVPLYYWFSRLGRGEPVNAPCPPRGSAALGGLTTQAGSSGWLHVEDDEAAIIEFDPAGATYASVVLYDWWMRSIDPWEHQSSLTQAMITPGFDGRCTCIASAQDNGYAGWLDTKGLRDMQIIVRWQGLPPETVRDGPTLSVRIVKLDSLEEAAGPNLPRVTVEQREAALAERTAAFERRFVAAP
jgi:hypothetical protein